MAQDATIRIGKISSIDYETGQARVLYEDRDNTVTVEIPISKMEDTGLMYENDSVLVAHLSNGTAKGIIVGRFHADSNPPVNGKKDFYRKDFSRSNEAYLQYDKDNEQLILEAPDILVITKEGEEHIIPKLQDHEKRIKELEERVTKLEEKISKLGG